MTKRGIDSTMATNAGKDPRPGANPAPPGRPLKPAAVRALAEAADRRVARDRELAARPKELHGRNGPDPSRYGDWEVKGIASDF